MNRISDVKLIFNSDTHSHRANIVKSFKGAKRLECVVAFARNSGFDLIRKPLIDSLKSGLEARFSISLNFCQTDPDLLSELIELREKYDLSLYLNNSKSTFHPKIYAVSN